MTSPLGHRLTRMTGRDPHRPGRAATTLELFYDLVFVVAFSAVGSAMAEHLADGQYRAALLGFALSTFAAIWAWINFAWFASAFDTDDWFFRVLTLIQMIGIAVMSLGVPDVFDSLSRGNDVDNRVMIVGYIIMRIGMVAQWLRAAVQSERYRSACLVYVGVTLIAQVGWVLVLLADMTPLRTLVAMLVCVLVEFGGPYLAETRASGTPWNAHHIADRYASLTIVTLGEGIVGTVAVIGAGIQTQGWSMDTAVIGLSSMTATFAMWWIYFVVPVGDALQANRAKCFFWGYGHMVIFAAAAAVGAGLHVSALYLEHHARIDDTVAVAAIAIPMALYCIGILVMYEYLLPFDPLGVATGATVTVILVAAVVSCALGGSVIVAIAIVTLAPVSMVLLDEMFGVPRRARAVLRIANDNT